MIRVTFVTCTFKFYSSRNLEQSIITFILIINNLKVNSGNFCKCYIHFR